MSANIRLNHSGIAAILKSDEMRALVKGAADEIASNVRAQGIRVDDAPGDVELPVEVSTTTTDRAKANVVLAHPSGTAVQAKHGALTKAASAAGIRVR